MKELDAIRASVARDDDRQLEHYAQKDRRYLLDLVDELAQTLLKYGRHKPDCQMYGLHHCTCGWYGEYLRRDEIIRSQASGIIYKAFAADGEVNGT